MIDSSNPITKMGKSMGFLFLMAFGWTASCSSSDEALSGGQVAHPVEPHPEAGAPLPSTSHPASSAPPLPQARSDSDDFEYQTGLKLSPRDKSIMDDCPERAWSQNVPKGSCAKDDECGDGFCDRGRCAPLWTCRQTYSRPCEQAAHCGPSYLCLNGRCQSCISDAECKPDSSHQHPRCILSSFVSGARGCYGVVPSVLGETKPNPPP